MPENWDNDYNPGSLTIEEMNRVRQAEWLAQAARSQARRNLNVVEIPELTADMLRSHFNSYSMTDRDLNNMFIHANRIMWICHDCGAFGFKYNVKELFRCYGWNCHSRNVTVARAGDISLALREYMRSGGACGRLMSDIFADRQNRLREARRARRTS